MFQKANLVSSSTFLRSSALSFRIEYFILLQTLEDLHQDVVTLPQLVNPGSSFQYTHWTDREGEVSLLWSRLECHRILHGLHPEA